MGYTVLRPEDQAFAPPSWRPDEPVRRVVEVSPHLTETRANLWRYPAGARGRRHRDLTQEEVFCVVEGTLTMLLGDPPERVELPPRSIVAVEAGTPLQLRNDTDADVYVFAYGAPPEQGNVELLEAPD